MDGSERERVSPGQPPSLSADTEFSGQLVFAVSVLVAGAVRHALRPIQRPREARDTATARHPHAARGKEPCAVQKEAACEEGGWRMSAGGFVNAPVTKSIIGLTTLATLGVRVNPTPTIDPTPSTLNHPPPKPGFPRLEGLLRAAQLDNPKFSTRNLKPCNINSQHQPSTLNHQPSTLNPQPSTLNPTPSTLHPGPWTLSPEP